MLQITLDSPGTFSSSLAPAPVHPLAEDEALVRVHRIGVCGTDLHAFAGNQPFFTYPRILGHELGVEVVAVGSDVHHVSPGDRCAVEPYLNCGRCIACRRGRPNCCADLKVIGVHLDGGMREFMHVPARKLHKSAKLSFEQLALIETLAIGAHATARAEIGSDDVVLVLGSGPIGLSVIQFARSSGCRLIVADVSSSRLEFCRERTGVKETILVGPDFKQRLLDATDGQLPTAIIDATGNAQSMTGTFDLCAQGATIVFVGLFQGSIAFNDPNFHRRELTLRGSRNALPVDFSRIIAAVEAGELNTDIWITHQFTLPDVPSKFPEVAGDRSLLKAMISI